MSATPRRFGDPAGTAAILNYFGGIRKPVYAIEDAIRDGHLCHYFYYPEIVKLTETEQNEWDQISSEISRLYAMNSSSDDNRFAERIKSKLLKRAKIVKNAQNKIQLAKTILTKNYKDGQRWIVYCDNQNQMRSVLTALRSSNIERVYEYHSGLNDDVRRETLSYFYGLGGIIVSIKCLDEGIDIPQTSHALILASSQNPREFIQRRGRILRKSEGKYFAYLYDAIVVPNNLRETDRHSRIVETELVRAINFGINSDDSKCITDLKLVAIDNEIDFKELYNNGIEDE